MTDEEEWRPARGWEAYYEVSDLGRVRRICAAMGATVGRILRPMPMASGHQRVRLCGGGKRTREFVHALVCEAFYGPRPAGFWVRHLDGDATNNRARNLRWGTPKENSEDTLLHGTHVQASKTRCPAGHPYSPENTYRRPARPGRRCRTCATVNQRIRRSLAA